MRAPRLHLGLATEAGPLFNERVPTFTRPAVSLRLKSATDALHTEAESHAFVARAMRGELSVETWRAFLAELLPLYEALEDELRARGDRTPYRAFVVPKLARAPRLRDDLAALGAPEAPGPVGTSAARWVRSLRTAPHRLLAHAYARYFGDLMGGRILRRAMTARLGDVGLSFLEFDFARPAAEVDRLRAALDAHPFTEPEVDDLLDEAQAAFRIAIELYDAALAAPRPGSPSRR
jgi:heme oxygenase